MSYTFDGNLAKALASADLSHVRVGRIQMLVYPQRNVALNRMELTASFVARVFDSNSGKEHLAIVSYGVDVKEGNDNTPYRVRCGDKFLSGAPRMGVSDEAQKQENVNSCEQVVKDLGLGRSAFDKLISAYGLFKSDDVDVNGACKFYANWRKDKSWCEHTEAFLKELQKTHPDWKEELKQAYEAFIFMPAKSSAAVKYAFRVPVLLEGPQGSGKTTCVRELAETGDGTKPYPLVEIGGHEDMEAAELLGYYIQAIAEDGRAVYVWKDGQLSKAFRMARKQKVVLLFDELLRVPTQHLSILLTALSPTSSGKYRLATNRALSIEDGVADIEVLECPVENLAFIATTNVGADYVVHMTDKALDSRFVKEYMPTTVESLKKILKSVCQKQGLPEDCGDKLIKFFNAMTDAHTRGLVADVPSTRNLVRALEQATTKSWEGVVEVLQDQALSWVARDADGAPVKEQLASVETLINKSA